MNKSFLCIVGLLMGAVSVEAEVAHFAFSSHQPNAITFVSESGLITRQITSVRHPQEFDLLPDGSVFSSELLGAVMLSASDEVLWRYKAPEGCQNPVAQILGHQRYLVGNEGPGLLLEIDTSGTVLKEIPLSPKSKAHHGQFRFCRKTEQGTYLAPLTQEGAVHEVASDGTLVCDFGHFKQPVAALRIAKGHTLIGSLRRLDEFDAEGELVWTFDPVADGGLGEGEKGHVCGIVEMEEGVIAFAFYHGEASWPDVMVVNRDKKILKSYILPEINKVAALHRVPSER